MKNLHSLPTDKPSRLIRYTTGEYHLLKEPIFIDAPLKPSRHIYITSDEEIKEGDCSFYPPFGVGRNIIINGELCFHIEAKNFEGSFTQRTYQTLDLNKKIVLTTDQDLINDGVQEIPDEFLEWFVKNPNCEEIKIHTILHEHHFGFDKHKKTYKIIIPKEEDFELVSIGEETVKLPIPMIQDKEEYKQETLEEAAERLYPTTVNSFTDSGFDMSETERLIFINGAKWQQKQNKNLYSEKDMIEFADFYYQYKELIKLEKWEIIEVSKKDVFKKWFEQFKKK